MECPLLFVVVDKYNYKLTERKLLYGKSYCDLFDSTIINVDNINLKAHEDSYLYIKPLVQSMKDFNTYLFYFYNTWEYLNSSVGDIERKRKCVAHCLTKEKMIKYGALIPFDERKERSPVNHIDVDASDNKPFLLIKSCKISIPKGIIKQYYIEEECIVCLDNKSNTTYDSCYHVCV